MSEEGRRVIRKLRAKYRQAAMKDVLGFGYFDAERALRNMDRTPAEIMGEIANTPADGDHSE